MKPYIELTCLVTSPINSGGYLVNEDKHVMWLITNECCELVTVATTEKIRKLLPLFDGNSVIDLDTGYVKSPDAVMYLSEYDNKVYAYTYSVDRDGSVVESNPIIYNDLLSVCRLLETLNGRSYDEE